MINAIRITGAAIHNIMRLPPIVRRLITDRFTGLTINLTINLAIVLATGRRKIILLRRLTTAGIITRPDPRRTDAINWRILNGYPDYL